MYQVDKDQLRQILIDELDYTPGQAEAFVSDFPLIHDDLSPVLQSWLEDRTVSDVVVSGVSLADIMKRRRYNFVLALRTLNQLLDPEMAPEQRVHLIDSLHRPLIRW